jgi:hypothetical protein
METAFYQTVEKLLQLPNTTSHLFLLHAAVYLSVLTTLEKQQEQPFITRRTDAYISLFTVYLTTLSTSSDYMTGSVAERDFVKSVSHITTGS